VRRWDLAATENDGAFTAGLAVGKTYDGRYIILGLVHVQYAAGKRDALIEATARTDGRSVWQAFPVDPGAAGKQVAHDFVRKLDGISPVRLMPESGDKLLRATLPASIAANGLLYIVDEPWSEIVVNELCDAGPGADYLDILDALSGAYTFLSPIAVDSDESSGSHSLRTRR
jgi:predicted phage terminase large subunit-like protein